MDDVFSTVFEAVENIVDLLDDPAIAERWQEPSALQGLRCRAVIRALARRERSTPGVFPVL